MHVLITGGTRGIGEAMVRAFHENGYKVSFTYLKSKEKAKELEMLENVAGFMTDSKNEAAVTEMTRAAKEKFGPVDVLINNAGISSFSLFQDLSYETWREMMATNLDGAFLFTREVLPDMIHNQKGKIINISSVWGLVGSSCEVHYSTSKAAIIGMTKALAKELAPSNIQVNCIAPGVIDTDMNKVLSGEDKENLIEEIPVGRLGRADEVANLALFLASDASDYITGQVITQSGGFVM